MVAHPTGAGRKYNALGGPPAAFLDPLGSARHDRLHQQAGMKRKEGPLATDRAIAILLVVAVLSASIVHLMGKVNVYDDAYITYRYVENIHEGLGAVYNEGERVFGVTSPLYLLWLVILRYSLPGIDLPVLAVAGNLIFLLATCALILVYVRSLGLGSRAGAVAAIAVILSPILRVSMGGLEMSLFLALIAATLLALRRDLPGAALWLASLAALTRPEGMFLVGIVLPSIILRKDRRLTRLAGLLPLAVWTAWSVWYYGSPIPHSVIAKAQPLYPLPPGAALLELIREMGEWSVGGILTLAGLIAPTPDPQSQAVAPVLRLVGLAVTSWILLRWKRAAGAARGLGRWALPAFLISMVVFYAIGNPLIFSWYYPPFQACWIILAIAAGLGPAGRGKAMRVVNGSVLGLVLLTVVISFAAALAPSDLNLLDHGADGRLRGEVLASYARAAAWIERNSQRTDRVAAPEIGILGYTLDRKILDACGLVSPEAIPFLPVPPEQSGGRQGVISTDFVMATRPEWVLTNPLHARKSLLASRWFLDQYEVVHEDYLDVGGGPALNVLVFRRRP